MGALDGRDFPGRITRILVLDDDATFRMLARRTLEAAHWEVFEASDAERGLDLYEAIRPDLVLIDLLLPDMDGFEICRRLRRRWGEETAPIVMTTAGDQDAAVTAGYEVGVTDFLSKPLDWNLLRNRAQFILTANSTLRRLRESERSLAIAQRIARLGSWTWYVRDNEMQWSDETFRILGFARERETASSEAFRSRFHPDDRRRIVRVFEEAVHFRKGYRCEHRILLPDGEARHVRQQCEVMFDEERGGGVVVHGTLQDITEHARAVDRAHFLANYDSLTGLSNRRLFRLRLGEAISRAHARGRRLALLFMDLDQFKRINDTLGHTVGDQLLQAVADRIMGVVRPGDKLGRDLADRDDARVARLGGDEFTLLLPEVADAPDAARVAQRILEIVNHPVSIAEGREVTVTTSVGIALFPEHGGDVETLIRSADTSMYRAKDAGGNTYRFFDRSMNALSTRRLTIESQLREALDRDQFQLYFQPKINLESNCLTGMETLLRWHHPELGDVSPTDFIPVAEACGLIVTIGDWVLRKACEQNKSWQEAGHPSLPIAVNVSSHQFAHHGLQESVLRALRDSGLDPAYLELEITESAMMEDERDAATTLGELKNLGLRVSLDDFGTGFSSLSYVKRFPLDTLKIDRSFVRDLPGDPDAAGIVAAIVAMARVLRLRVVAEGVENEAQRTFLRDCHCHEMQGYLVSPPRPAPEFERFFEMATSEMTGAIPAWMNTAPRKARG